MVCVFATQYLRRHVEQRATGREDRFQTAHGVGLIALRFRSQAPRQAEIEHLYQALWSNRYVLTLEIPMNNTASMRVRERAGDLRAISHHRIVGKSALADQGAQRLALDQLH